MNQQRPLLPPSPLLIGAYPTSLALLLMTGDRRSKTTSQYSHIIGHADDFGVVLHSERVQSSVHAVPSTQTRVYTQYDSESAALWLPDYNDYALDDPSGDQYSDAVGGHAYTADGLDSSSAKRKRKARSKVSVSDSHL